MGMALPPPLQKEPHPCPSIFSLITHTQDPRRTAPPAPFPPSSLRLVSLAQTNLGREQGAIVGLFPLLFLFFADGVARGRSCIRPPPSSPPPKRRFKGLLGTRNPPPLLPSLFLSSPFSCKLDLQRVIFSLPCRRRHRHHHHAKFLTTVTFWPPTPTTSPPSYFDQPYHLHTDCMVSNAKERGKKKEQEEQREKPGGG